MSKYKLNDIIRFVPFAPSDNTELIGKICFIADNSKNLLAIAMGSSRVGKPNYTYGVVGKFCDPKLDYYIYNFSGKDLNAIVASVKDFDTYTGVEVKEEAIVGLETPDEIIYL